MYKNNQKPNIKTYTLKDYRQFKKDSGIPSTTSTGKLGFDFDSLNYKEKVILMLIYISMSSLRNSLKFKD
jgi:hypothetical protein